MRVAVLSLIEPAGAGDDGLRAFLRIGGRSVLRHQIGLALSLGCRRIAIMAEAISGELVALQHVAEAGGAQFHVVATARALVPLILPEDDVIVLGDGLLAMPDAMRDLIEAGPALLTLPIESGLPLGFERIDINHAFAGAMRVGGRIAAGLADLPPEWSVQSALLRLAMQARVVQRGVPAGYLDDGRWSIVRNEDEAHRIEGLWLSLHTGIASRTSTGSGFRTPGDTLASVIVRRFGPAMLHAGTRPALIGLAAGAVGLLGGGAGWLGHYATGMVLIGLAWLVERVASLLAQVERASLLASGFERRSVAVFHLLIDAGLVTLAAWRSDLNLVPGLPPGAAAFVPILLIGSTRLAPAILSGRGWAYWLEDRLMLGCALALVSLFAPFDLVIGMLVLGLLGVCLILVQNERPADADMPSSGASPNPQLTSRP
ncbi:CDP-alcohol phosphatidyltransferase [Novosphingobium lubricantis]